MRIAFYAPRASFLGPGVVGESVFLNNLMGALRERGHEIEIISHLNVRDVWRGRLPARQLVTEAVAIRRRLKRLRPDALIVFGSCVTYADLFGWWQRPQRYLLVGVDPYTSGIMPRRWRWLFAFADRRSLARADAVCAQRPSCAQRLRPLGVDDARLSVLLPGVEVWDDIPFREEARRQLGLPLEARVVLCVSRLPEGRERSKTDAVLDLLAAQTNLPRDTLLVLAGDGPGRARVEARIAELGLEARVVVLGFAHDIKLLYAACDVFAYPLGLDRPWVTVLEAQSCGRPVVVMRTTSAEVTVDAGHTGLLARDSEEFRAHVETLLCDEARRNEMGQKARSYVTSFHSIEARVGQLEGLLAGEG